MSALRRYTDGARDAGAAYAWHGFDSEGLRLLGSVKGADVLVGLLKGGGGCVVECGVGKVTDGAAWCMAQDCLVKLLREAGHCVVAASAHFLHDWSNLLSVVCRALCVQHVMYAYPVENGLKVHSWSAGKVLERCCVHAVRLVHLESTAHCCSSIHCHVAARCTAGATTRQSAWGLLSAPGANNAWWGATE